MDEEVVTGKASNNNPMSDPINGLTNNLSDQNKSAGNCTS
jgi:hypothetical protein